MCGLLPHSCFLSFPPQVSTRFEFTIQKIIQALRGFLESALTLPTNTERARSSRYLLKSGFVYFLLLSPSVLFEAAELLTRSLTFCAFQGILGRCRTPEIGAFPARSEPEPHPPATGVPAKRPISGSIPSTKPTSFGEKLCD